MFECWPQPAQQVMQRADQESDRLGHGYVGCEHVLAALAGFPGPAAAVLARHGLSLGAVRCGLRQLVAQGVLPPPWRNDAYLLGSLGVDLAAVRRSMAATFGADALETASRLASRRTGWHGLTGKPILVKRALQLASTERQRRGHGQLSPEHLLLGVLRDAQDPLDRPRCFNNRRARQRGAAIGLPQRGPSPVRLLVEARGARLTDLYEAVAAEFRAPV